MASGAVKRIAVRDARRCHDLADQLGRIDGAGANQKGHHRTRITRAVVDRFQRSRERLGKIRLPLIEIKNTLLPLTFGYQSARNDSSEKVSGGAKPLSANIKLESPMKPITTTSGFRIAYSLKKVRYSEEKGEIVYFQRIVERSRS